MKQQGTDVCAHIPKLSWSSIPVVVQRRGLSFVGT
jgi:hypothetical protein